MIKVGPSLGIIISLASSSASSGPLEDAYRKGYVAGYQAALQPGTTNAGVDSETGTGTLFLPGSEFTTMIKPKSGTTFQVTPDSSVAIIPNRSLDAFQDKLGADFLRDNKILLNDGAAAQ